MRLLESSDLSSTTYNIYWNKNYTASEYAFDTTRKSGHIAEAIRAGDADVALVDPDGNQFDIAGKETVALCRCGQSKNRPFCDGQHKACGFIAGERAVPPIAPQ